MPSAAPRSVDFTNTVLNTERDKNQTRNETISKLPNCEIPKSPQSQSYKLPQRPHMKTKTIAVVNSSGRQAASFIRVASAVGYNVRAQLRNLDGIVATEISSLPHVTVFVGELSSPNAQTTLIRS
jgi:rhodanese-related sulfurtransferase